MQGEEVVQQYLLAHQHQIALCQARPVELYDIPVVIQQPQQRDLLHITSSQNVIWGCRIIQGSCLSTASQRRKCAHPLEEAQVQHVWLQETLDCHVLYTTPDAPEHLHDVSQQTEQCTSLQSHQLRHTKQRSQILSIKRAESVIASQSSKVWDTQW